MSRNYWHTQSLQEFNIGKYIILNLGHEIQQTTFSIWCVAKSYFVSRYVSLLYIEALILPLERAILAFCRIWFLVGNGIYFKLQYLGISLGMSWIRKSNEKTRYPKKSILGFPTHPRYPYVFVW